MKKATKMKICDRGLVLALAIMLASSIQLEATGGKSATWVWVHIALGILFLAGVGWHLAEHFRWTGWIRKLRRQKSPATRWLGLFYALTTLSGAAALICWLSTGFHSSLGGWHGKIGFIFLALCIGHTFKRRNSPMLFSKTPCSKK